MCIIHTEYILNCLNCSMLKSVYLPFTLCMTVYLANGMYPYCPRWLPTDNVDVLVKGKKMFFGTLKCPVIVIKKLYRHAAKLVHCQYISCSEMGRTVLLKWK